MKIFKTKKLLIALISALVFGAQMTFAAGVPENVTDVEASALGADSIGLTWTSALDDEGGLVDHYRIYYGPTSVFEAGEGDYESEMETPTNETATVVSGLLADTMYYFSITAISSDDEESTEYSYEDSATTMTEDVEPGEEPTEEPAEEDTVSPTVTGVSAPDKLHVVLNFSEPVALPTDGAEAAFGIIEQINPANTLTVVSARVDDSDASNVILETLEQTASVNYIVTAGVSVKDLADNPIVSGSTDSALFLGSGAEPSEAEPVTEEEPTEEPADETPEPELISEPATDEAADCEKDMNCFLEHVASGDLAKVTESDDTHEYTLEIVGADATDVVVRYTAERHPNILFGGTDMDCVFTKQAYTADEYRDALDLDNCSGSLADGYEAVEAAADTTPPENITNLLLSFKDALDKFTVILRWTPSLNTARDLVDQILYMSLDRGNNYDSGKSLGASVTNTEVKNLEGGKEYTFKMTTKDDSGNESTGAVKSIRLPQTGVGVGLLLMISALGAGRALRRKED